MDGQPPRKRNRPSRAVLPLDASGSASTIEESTATATTVPDEESVASTVVVPSDDLEVRVVSLAGTAVGTWWLGRASLVCDLKELVRVSTGARASQQQLVAGTEILRDGRALGDVAGPGAAQLHVSFVRRGFGRALGGCSDGTVRVWDLESSEVVRAVGACGLGASAVYCVVGEWGGHRVLAGGATGLFLCNAEDNTVIHSLRVGISSEDALRADWPSQRALAGTMAGPLVLWSFGTADQHAQELRGHTSSVDAVAVDWPSAAAVTASRDKTLRLWDLVRGRCLRVLRGHTGSVQCVAVDWASRRVLSGSLDGSLALWSVRPREAAAEASMRHGAGGAAVRVSCLAADWASGRALSGGGCRAVLWDLVRQEVLWEYQVNAGACLGVFPNWAARRLVVADCGGQLALLDLADGRLLRLFATSGCTGLQSPRLKIDWDGRKMLYGCGQKVRLLDLDTGEDLRTLPELTAEEGRDGDGPPGRPPYVTCLVAEWDG